ncbi:MAG: 3'-5' exonuclease [Oscillospiraceae bacterium]|nr:3'-5' exonuclease [Oscillospiraceae bacterium]
MGEKYIAFDVETPNYANNRMSAIGVAVVEDGAIAEEFYSLVNPETHFDWFNINLTGITPEMAAEAPAFPVLWEKLRPLMEGGLLAAHNAPFDMSVLAKCLLHYGIRWRPRVEYICTCRTGRRLLPDLPNHKLNTMCDYLNLDLDHHHAGSDSRACGEILLHYLRSGADLGPFVRTYNMMELRTERKSERKIL